MYTRGYKFKGLYINVCSEKCYPSNSCSLGTTTITLWKPWWGFCAGLKHRVCVCVCVCVLVQRHIIVWSKKERSLYTCFLFVCFLIFSYSWHTLLVSGIQHNTVIRYSYNFQRDPFDKSWTHLAPYVVITVLLTINLMLHFTSLWLFYNCQLVL